MSPLEMLGRAGQAGATGTATGNKIQLMFILCSSSIRNVFYLDIHKVTSVDLKLVKTP